MTAALAPPATIEEFLAETGRHELLRFTTAGSVDDGKSTLIGRLLYDSKGVYEDQLSSIRNSRVNRSTGPIDFSLLTDGLRAEREQGITIDVAYRYFATPRRKFIIADTPGHEQYTRNMATGASTASLAVILVDARKGLLPQSRRHAYISSLLGIPRVVLAVNKMDLVDFSRDVFEAIRRDFAEFSSGLGFHDICAIPMSALEGDNVVTRSPRTPWHRGQCLLEHLETVPIAHAEGAGHLRFPVQYVIRPDLDFRGYAGQLADGLLHPGDSVMALPSGRTSRVKSIATYDGELSEAFPPMSVTVTLKDEIDVSRGDMLVDPAAMPHVSRRFEASLVWMHPEPMLPVRPFLLKHTTRTVQAVVSKLHYRVDVNTLAEERAVRLDLNEIGVVEIEARQTLFFDSYRRNRATGSFVLIDPITNATVAAGMIREQRGAGTIGDLEYDTTRVTAEERRARNAHEPATVWLAARKELAWKLERRLFEKGCQVHALADETESHLLPEVSRILNAAGMIVICSVASDDETERERAREIVGASRFLAPRPEDIPAEDGRAVERICRMLEGRGFLGRRLGFGGEGI